MPGIVCGEYIILYVLTYERNSFWIPSYNVCLFIHNGFKEIEAMATNRN